MGSLQEELIKKLGARKPRNGSNQASNIAGGKASTSISKENISLDAWTEGVTPLKKGGLNNGTLPKKASSAPELKWSGTNFATSLGRADTSAHQSEPEHLQNAQLTPKASSCSLELEKTGGEPLHETKSALVHADFGAIQQPALAREQEYRTPASWVAKGHLLQSAELGGQGRLLRVRIGIDFGTAYTKVAIRAADKVFFVTWEGVYGGRNPYLLPGEICQDSMGALWLGRAPAAVHVTSDLKLPFIKEVATSEGHSLMTLSYLAWVMRYSRAWLYEHQESLVRGRRLAWEINIGSPTNSWMSSQINPEYRRIGKLAWKLSQTSTGITNNEAARVLACDDIADENIGEIGLDGIYLVPEFVAQVAGYANSNQRRNGLHLLVDVGAGTVDIACFELWKAPVTEMNSFPIRSSLVEPLGTHFLMQNRLDSLGTKLEQWDDQADVLNIEAFSRIFKVPMEHCTNADLFFADSVTKAIYRVVASTKAQDTKEYGYPRAPEWTKGIPVFLTGGGSSSDAYRNALADAFQQLNLKMLVTPLRPQLGNTTMAREAADCFHRLSVAFGLTWDAESIGRIYRPEPPNRSLVRRVKNRPDRDELYAK